jgi:pyruvate formate lyase activating enzyme
MRKPAPSAVTTADYWHRLEDGRIQCDVCPRFCALREGQRGLCFVRARQGDRIVLTTYGRSSGFCVDPIEKKPLNHFLPGTAVLSFGTEGCNLSCLYCQNWDISKSREISKLADEASPELIARAARQLNCRSVAFTYNEPTIFLEYAIDVAEACHEAGIATVAVTAGYVCEKPREDLFREIDAANVDLKSFTDEFYRKVTGARLQPVLETLAYLKKSTSVWLEITNLVIPGYNDSEKEIDRMTRWVVETLGPDVPIHFSAFHPDWKMREVPPTPPPTLARARKIAIANGARYVYTGNIRHREGETTRCHACGACLIGRDGFELTEWNLEKGKCSSCGEPCSGVFEEQPGQWGAHRLPVRLKDFAA